VRRKHDLKR